MNNNTPATIPRMGGAALAGMWLAGLLACPEADACRYSVREVAFAELAASGYALVVTPPPGGAAEESGEALDEELARRFRHSGVACQVAPGAEEARETPGAALVSPGGRRLPLELPDGGSVAERLAGAVLRSQAQKELREVMPDHLCALVIVHGTNEAATARAKDMAASAARQVKARLPTLERPMEKGAAFVEIPPDRFERERILLWSLGIDTETPPVEPRIAAVFGRGRRFGPVMKPEDVGARKLADLLCLAGASCECGLDRSWMQGPMIPLAWTRQDQARIAAELGFDPESPLVALEMRQILAQAGAGAPETQAGLADIPASGYREVSLASLTPPEEEPEAPPAEQAAQDPPRPPDAARTLPAAAVGQEAGPPPQDETRRGPRRNYGVWTLVAALVLVNLAGTFRIWRRRQRSRSA